MRNRLLPAILLLVIVTSAAFAQETNIVRKDLSQAQIDRIISRFTANESAFRGALTNYVFNRYATLSIIGMGGQIAGTYHRDSFMALNPDGSRFEKIMFFPVATTPPGFVTPEDLEDLGGITPFALEPATVPQYDISYVGTEKIDELNLYVFDVRPKVMPDSKSKQRLFIGRIWVDMDDLMIVKSKGKAAPETKENKFPIVETTREQIDGKYWFPTDARSDDELVFDNGSVTKIRLRVRYTNYKLGHTDVRILDEDEQVDETPSPTPTPLKPRS
jgi:hypothetical protein